ncbi:MAG: hypothetical protein ACKOEM_18200 [Planctomycetia bacterium]
MTPEASKPLPKTKTSPKKSAGKEVNKSAEIRRVAGAMKAKGEKPRPIVIIEVLKREGVTVSSPQVSMVLKGMGFRPRRRRKGGKQASKPVATQPARKASKVKVEDLVKAKRIVSQMGGVDHALAVLHALKDFER